jgi:putative ABC transport system substrate-binding protein
MRRRNFITFLGGVAAVWPLAARGQQGERMRRVGVLLNDAADDPDVASRLAAFQQRLAELGWTPGRNIRIEIRLAANDVDRRRAYAAELVGLAPDVILVSTSIPLQAMLLQTHAIPIVFYLVSDPLGDGFVASLARPGGNVTGFANNEFSIGGKWLELLKDIAPKLNRVMALLDPENPTWRGYMRAIETAASASGLRVVATPVVDQAGIERAVEDFAREPDGGIVILPGPALNAARAVISRYRLPAVYPSDADVRDGGLASYGTDRLDQIRKAAGYVDRILKGEKPGDLPIQQPTKFNLIINLKTAKAIGLDIPQTILGRADEVIE